MEIFKDIKGYENYQVSNLGNVKSLGNDKTRKEKILKPNKLKNNYLQVVLCKEGKRKYHLIHRLVAEAFIPNHNNLPQLNHLDEDKTNNTISNLEWCTAKYNNNYGTRNKRVAESNINNPKRSKQVLCLETGVVYPSTHQVERQLGFAQGYISNACNGKLKTAYGFHWQYVIKKRVTKIRNSLIIRLICIFRLLYFNFIYRSNNITFSNYNLLTLYCTFC